MGDVPVLPPKRPRSRLALACLIVAFVIALLSLLIPYWEVQGPVLGGSASYAEQGWYLFFYSLPGFLGLISLREGFRLRRCDPEAWKHADDGTPGAMALAAVLVAYSVVDTALFFAF